METIDALKEHRDNLERELNILDGSIRVGHVLRDRSGHFSVDDASDEVPAISIALSAQSVRPDVTATPQEAMDCARVLVGAVMDIDGEHFDELWEAFKNSIVDRRSRVTNNKLRA